MRRNWHKRLLSKDQTIALLFIAPTFLLLLSLGLYPLVKAVWLSFTDKIIGRVPSYVGTDNYQWAIHSPVFWQALFNTLKFTLAAVAFKFAVGSVIAVSLLKLDRARNFVRGLFLLPWVIPAAISSLIWLWMFYDVKGILNYLFEALGIVGQDVSWLGDPTLAMASVITVNVWRDTPFFVIALYAGLQSIPSQLYELAELDGVPAVPRFLRITIPSLKNVVLIVLFLSFIWTFSEFQTVFIMTRGGPANATQIFATLSYELGFAGFRLGQAMAASLCMAPLLLIPIIIFSYALPRMDIW